MDVALSAVNVVELTHGIYRVRTDADRTRRQIFVESALHDLVVHAVSVEIAQNSLAGLRESKLLKGFR
jgi:hypothetical protein